MAAKADTVTKQQEAYIQALLLNDSQRTAYRKAYPKSIKWTDNTTDVRASKLYHTDKVFIRFNELNDAMKKKAEEEGLLSRIDVLKKLNDLIIRNEEVDDRVALDGLKTYGKHHSLFNDKIEHSGKIEMPTVVIGK